MKKLIFLFSICLTSFASFGQKYEVIIQLQSADTLVYRSVVSQIANLKKSLPDATIEMVCQGPGLDFLLKDKPLYANRLNKLGLKDVSVVGCEFSMSHRNLKKDDLVPFAGTVTSGIVEIVKKEKAGWQYLKAGF